MGETAYNPAAWQRLLGETISFVFYKWLEEFGSIVYNKYKIKERWWPTSTPKYLRSQKI